jgi:hypothetical protein
MSKIPMLSHFGHWGSGQLQWWLYWRKKALLTLLVQLLGSVYACAGLHGTAISMRDTSAHTHDRPTVDHDAKRLDPPGDSRRYRNRTDNFDAKIAKM